MGRRAKPARGKALGILNPYGDLWTYETFDTEAEARPTTRPGGSDENGSATKTEPSEIAVQRQRGSDA